MRKIIAFFCLLWLLCLSCTCAFADTCVIDKVIVDHNSLYSDLLPGDLSFDVYMPACNDGQSAENYAVLYLLHGQEMGIEIWDEMGLSGILRDTILLENLGPFLIVVPQEDQYLLSLSLSGFGDTVRDYLIPWIDEHYPTCTERKCRGIAGISRGALWAEKLAFQNAGLFGSLGLLSMPGKLFDDQSLYYLAGEHRPDDILRIRMDIGSEDYYRHDAIKAAEQFVFIGYPFDFYLQQGDHNIDYWRPRLSDYMIWFSEGWQNLNLP